MDTPKCTSAQCIYILEDAKYILEDVQSGHRSLLKRILCIGKRFRLRDYIEVRSVT